MCSDADEPEGQLAKRNKPDKENLYDLPYM